MAIKATDIRTGKVTTTYEGRVIEVRTYKATRNLSDTLDYSDYQTVECTDALVYFGRRVPADHKGYVWLGSKMYNPGVEIPVGERFGTVDCSNHFAWRGSDHRVAEVDADFAANPEMLEDYIAWKAHHEELAREAVVKRAAYEAQEKARKEEEERNRPVVGKKMRVAKGRKVPVGTVGTVAFVSRSGSVLLKADHEWQDRKAQGIWINGRNLKAR